MGHFLAPYGIANWIARRPRSVATTRLAVWRGCAARVGLLAGAGLIPGCVPAGAPSLPFFGAYFPSWLACALIGILGAVALRFAFIRAGIDDAMPARLPVYVSIAAAIGFLASIIAFGR